MKRWLLWIFRRKVRCILVVLVLGFAALNLAAYLHARAMTTFVGPGYRTPKPGELTFWQKVETLCTGVRVPRPCSEPTPASQGLAYTTHRFPTADGLTLEAWHVEAPESRGLVVLHHGYATSKASLIREARVFHELGYDTLLVDFRGGGGSDGRTTTLGYDEARDVAAAFHYAKGLGTRGPVALYGQSMGAAAILRALAEEGAAPAAAILECPFDTLLTTVKHRFQIMGLPAFPVAHLLVFWGGVQHGFNGFAHAPVDYAKKTRCPVLLLVGAEDPLSTVPEVRSILDNLAGSRQMQVFDRGGHGGQLSTDPGAWNQAVAEFLNTIRTR